MTRASVGLARERGGFTLVEIIVAMTIGAIVLVGVRQAAVGVADISDATLGRARTAERAINGERLLRRLVAQMEPDSNATGGLVGDTTHAEFDAWCDVPDGWQERCRARIEIVPDSASGGARFVASSSTGLRAVLLQWRDRSTLCYLLDAADGGRWRADWDGRLSLPLAIGVVTGPDTLLVPVGVRE